MISIHKFEFALGGKWTFDIHPGGEIVPLTVQVQGDHLALWYECNTEATLIKHYNLSVILTGEEIPGGNFTYITTLQVHEYVLHFYIAETSIFAKQFSAEIPDMARYH